MGSQVWNGDLLHDGANVLEDVAGFIAGPPGDPARIRQTASVFETLSDHYDADGRAINEAVDELLNTWQGDSATAFQTRWYGDGGTPAPAQALAHMTARLDRFVAQLRDYADQLEHAQHDHWIQMAVLTAMTVINVAQGGLDPATDAAEVGMAAVDTVSTGFDLAEVGTLAVKGAFAGFTSDIAGQAGADIWDHFFESSFDATGNHAVSLFDPAELVVSTAAGGGGASVLRGGSQLFASRIVTRSATVITVEDFPRLTDAERSTLAGILQHSDLRGQVFRQSPHIGAEVVDDLGRSYDFMGQPKASQFWNPERFFASLRDHLLKSNDFTVVDLRGFAPQHAAAVQDFIRQLPETDQRRIIHLGP